MLLVRGLFPLCLCRSSTEDLELLRLPDHGMLVSHEHAKGRFAEIQLVRCNAPISISATETIP